MLCNASTPRQLRRVQNIKWACVHSLMISWVTTRASQVLGRLAQRSAADTRATALAVWTYVAACPHPSRYRADTILCKGATARAPSTSPRVARIRAVILLLRPPQFGVRQCHRLWVCACAGCQQGGGGEGAASRERGGVEARPGGPPVQTDPASRCVLPTSLVSTGNFACCLMDVCMTQSINYWAGAGPLGTDQQCGDNSNGCQNTSIDIHPRSLQMEASPWTLGPGTEAKVVELPGLRVATMTPPGLCTSLV